MVALVIISMERAFYRPFYSAIAAALSRRDSPAFGLGTANPAC
jgi:hypothetical protein